ncbi:ATP-binding protein [Marinomonas primoryensis]|uniref:ATP-binding protein n=1 Tax=Marinomonas primoryensis TaxID=178399 RepID=A0A859D052_9GAMM|nr:ATP-binding protein [Marinomonas primoryensis]QKK82177.1 ATP-binding protein [Marinomonas primoryensis]
MNDVFQERFELKIGKIVEVSGNSLRIEIDDNVSELIRAVDGQVYPIGQIGSIIKVHFGRKLLFAFVRSLKMRSELVSDDSSQFISAADDARILEADLFGQGSWSVKHSRLDFLRGVETYPLPLQSAYICLNDELEAVYKAAESNAQDEAVSPMVPIGNYIGGNNAVCRANIDKLFGHHFAILGSTGSGKSGTVASILHSVLDHRPKEIVLKPKIVMIDPHGEYAKAFGDRAKVYRAYNDAAAVDADDTQLLKLPYWLMSSDELRSLIIGKTEHEATSQNNIIYEAITYSRLLNSGYVQDIGAEPNGGVEAILVDGFTETDLLNFDRDKPVPFKLEQFTKHINKVQGRKFGKQELLAASSGRDKVDNILKKLKVLRSNPQLNFLLGEYDEMISPKLQDILAQFIGDADGKDIRIIDISGLPNEVAGPLTALIARLLFQYKLWQTREEREKDPVLFICEEAHRYVPNHGEAQYKEAQDAIRRIAKEGRKYGLGLGLISQRPSDVESTVLSQCNSWIVLRLSNSSDQEHVAKFLPDSLSGLTKMLSALTRREAIFVGEAAALPSRIRIRKLPKDKLPNSNDIKFAAGWSNDATSEESLDTIVNRWCGN